MQGDAFRGHDESSTSLNKGTFREMVDWYKDKVEIVKATYEKGYKNCQMLSPYVQKDLQHVESCTACRFVNDEGKVMERFLGLQHVESCTAIALKEALVRMLSKS